MKEKGEEGKIKQGGENWFLKVLMDSKDEGFQHLKFWFLYFNICFYD